MEPEDGVHGPRPRASIVSRRLIPRRPEPDEQPPPAASGRPLGSTAAVGNPFEARSGAEFRLRVNRRGGGHSGTMWRSASVEASL